VNLGVEARPETVASRFVWADYFADEDYFLPVLHVENMPHLKRGQAMVRPDGVMHDVRLERHLEKQKEVGRWKWRHNEFIGQRAFNGRRVLMALLNNRDLKDTHNEILDVKHSEQGGSELHYEVSDLGATFGTAGRSWTHGLSKNNVKAYQHSKSITKVTSD
jgi:hypothetical protein